MKRNVTSLAKFLVTKDDLKIKTYHLVGILECLWHTTAKDRPRGDIGRGYSNQDIVRPMEYDGDADFLISVLVKRRWIDEDDQSRLIVHDWDIHAEDAVHMFLARNGVLFANGKTPKINRLSKLERARVEPLLAEALSEFVRTKSAQNSKEKKSVRTEKAKDLQDLCALPSPSLSHSLSLSPPIAIALTETDSSAPASLEFSFPLKDGTVWVLVGDLYVKFCKMYAQEYVDFQLKKARLWLETNKDRQKTKRGMPRFLNAWLSRDQKPSIPSPDDWQEKDANELTTEELLEIARDAESQNRKRETEVEI